MKQLTHASTFSGIGGPEVAAAMLGWENLFHCEINPFGRRVLDYWFPNAKSYEDITKTDFTEWRGRVTVLTGGFPCQPFSYAGKRGGAEDDRYLWPYMLRCIEQVRPRWFVGENVAGITTMVEPGEVFKVGRQTNFFETLFNSGVHGTSFEDFLAQTDGDLAAAVRLADAYEGIYQQEPISTLARICENLKAAGYSVQPVLVPACAVGAPHRRDRVFFVARDTTTPDTDSRNDEPRTAGEDESEGREERLQERNEVRQSEQSTDVRPEGARTSPHTAGSGEGTPRASDEVEGSRSDTHQQPSERRAETERNNRLHAVLRHAPHPHGDRGSEVDEHIQSRLADGTEPFGYGRERNAADTAVTSDTSDARLQHGHQPRGERGETGAVQGQGSNPFWDVYAQADGYRGEIAEADGTTCAGNGRWQHFPSVSPVHRGNDGLPFPVDNLTIPFANWRTESLKAYGNAIVPQVMYEIFRAIQEIESETPK